MSALCEFLELVDCEANEVRDVPADRLGIDATREAQQSEGRITGTYEMPFGKHRGKKLDDVPREYLHWLIHQPSKGPFRKTKRIKLKIKKYLKAR